MRVALVCTEKLPVPPILGGAIQTYIDGVAPLLQQHDLDVTVFSVAHPHLPDRQVERGVSHIRLPGANQCRRYYQAVDAALRAQRFDTAVIYNRPKYLLPIAHNQSDTRFFLSMHNEMFTGDKMDPAGVKQVLERVRGVITVSQFLADGIARVCPEARPKLHPVYSGVDLEQFLPRWHPEAKAARIELRKELGLAGRQVLLYVGRLTDKKGAHVLIQSLAQLAAEFPRAVLLVVGSKWFGGDDPNDEYVQLLRRLGRKLTGRVQFTGWVPYDQVHKYYWAADIFVCASQWEEPLARVHYEAMASGVPIVTTRRGGNAEVVDGTGCGVVIDRYRDPAAFTAVFSQLLADPDRLKAMSHRGRQLAEERYQWDRVATDMARVLKSGSGESGRP